MRKIFNWKFPREVGDRRFVVTNMEQFLNYINSNNGCQNLYTNVYNFTEFYTLTKKPKYDSAVIDRIYVDFDKEIKRKKLTNLPAYENMLKLHRWCMERDIIHFPRCTGSAYDITIATEPDCFIKNKKECVANAQNYLSKILDVEIDPQVKDLARIQRITNTFNLKSTAMRYCIPLDEKIIGSGEENIFEMAKQPRFTSNSHGNGYWDISEFDLPESEKDDFPVSQIISFSGELSDLPVSTPQCVKTLLGKGNPSWQERRPIIIFFRDNCFAIEEADSILRKYLDSRTYKHCTREERQLKYLYRNEKYLFPHKEEMVSYGACSCRNGKVCENAKRGCKLYGR